MCNEEEHDGNEVLPEVSCIQTNIPLNSTVSVVGDDLDKNIKPRDMRINHQVKSLHFFDSFAVFSRMSTLSLNDPTPIQELSKVYLSAYS